LGDFQGAIAAFERGSFASGRANLPCITAAAAAEFHGGRHGRARQLFVQGNSVPRHLSTRRERAAHLRLWALLEKRAGGEETTRKLFIAATKEDRADAATWLQWGQWEKRVNSVDAARKVFHDGIRHGVNNGQYFLYQALATLEAETNNQESARELFKQGCSAHPRSASLWLQWALFELSCGEEGKDTAINSIRVIEKGVSRAPPHIPLLELWLNLEQKFGDEQKARSVEDRLKKLLSEQRYAPVGHEVN
jgi:predicted Zn-dependent protease